MPGSSRFYESPPWRFIVSAFDGSTVTFLDHLASNRTAAYTLNAPAVATCDVPSDNPEINIGQDMGGISVPFVSMADKIIYGFRREALSGQPPWKVRFAGVLQQPNDEITVDTDVPTTHISAYDPWQYLNAVPLLGDGGLQPGTAGLTYTSKTGDFIVLDILANALAGMDPTAPVAAQNMFLNFGQTPYTPFYTGTIETTPNIPSINFRQGMMVGEALTQLTQGGYLDLILEPIYDPQDQPGLCCQLSIYEVAGSQRFDAVFAWDKPGRTLVGMNRLQDGSQLANVGQGFAGQGGDAVTPQKSAASIARYGQYAIQTFYPSLLASPEVVEVLMAAQVSLRANGKQTLTLDPAPERSPIPFQEYYLGDQVPVWFTNAFRQKLNPVLDDDGNWTNYQRIFAIPITIPDDSTETVTQLLMTGPNADGTS